MSSKKNNDLLTAELLGRQLQLIVGNYDKQNLKVAYSGGLDSTVLLCLLAELGAARSLNVQAIHVHHGLHREADAWTESCIAQCRKLDIQLFVEKVSVMPGEHGLEAAARKVRYEALSRHIQSESDELLTAHHRDDQAETLLLHLVRGAGVNGLAGMPQRRRFGQGWLSRPLLEIDRASIHAYAVQHGLGWIEDDSNSDPDIRRSFLRHSVFPLLVQHWPGAIQSMAQAASHLREAEALLSGLAKDDLAGCRSKEHSSLSVTALARLTPERIRNVLRYWIASHGIGVPSTRQLAQLVQRIQHPPKTARAELSWGAHSVRMYRDRVWVSMNDIEIDAGTRLTWDLDKASSVKIGNMELSATEATGEGLARSRVGSYMEIRTRQGGERCQLPGRKHHTSVKSLFQQHHVPPWERETMPLLYVDNELAAIGDRWYCEPFAARSGENSWRLRLEKTGTKCD